MLALEGIKVLDLTMVIPGQFCTMFLADMGSDVLKVERHMEEAFLPAQILHRLNATRRLDRNKRSIVLNMKEKDGLQIFYDLVKGADVILEGFRPGATKGLRIDYETIKAINPKIVYCSLSGFGQDGPFKNLPGFDLTYISLSGVLDVVRDRRGFPVIPSNLIGDIAGGGMLAALGISMALVARERTGKGQYIDIGMTDGVIAILAQAFAMHWYGRENSMADGALEIERQPDYGIYETKGGKYISLSAITPWFWASLCKALGHEELTSQQDVVEKRLEVRKTLEGVFLTKTRDEWFDVLTKADVPVAKVRDLDEVAQCQQVKHRSMIVDFEDPVSKNTVKQIGLAIKLSETPGALRNVAPTAGQHTDEVLRKIGRSDTDIAKLREAKIVR